MSYVTIFRVHAWDDGIARMAAQARECCRGAEFVVTADETRGPLPIEGFTKLSHTDDFSAFGLPSHPADRVLWWNGDYVQYAVRAALPGRDYYVMLDYDTYLACDVDAMVARCAAESVDLVVHEFQKIAAGNIWYPTARSMTAEPWWAFPALTIASGRAVDAMLSLRQALAHRLRQDPTMPWPNLETLMPTAVALQPDMVVRELRDYVSTRLYRYRPYISIRDRRLAGRGLLAHPVLVGRRFVEAFVAGEPEGAVLMTDGRLRPELAGEDEADLRAVLGRHPVLGRDLERLLQTRDQPPAAVASRGVDLAERKPALQSSHSHWSKGASAAEDAGLAVGGELQDDYAFHTDNDMDPWWQVDLQRDSWIEQVEIVNRVEVPHKFSRFRIETSQDGTGWVTRLAKTDGRMVSSDPAEPFVFAPADPFVARYLRIVQLGQGVMHLRRVRVFGRIATGPSLPATLGADGLARLAQVHVYDIDGLAGLRAALESSEYAGAHMAAAARLPDVAGLLAFAARHCPPHGRIGAAGLLCGDIVAQLTALFPQRPVERFDSMAGRTPEPDTAPSRPQGERRRLFGWFRRPHPPAIEAVRERIGLLYLGLDADAGAGLVFDWQGAGIAGGTIIVFERYFNYPGWKRGAHQAIRESGGRWEYLGLVPTGQSVAIRMVEAPRPKPPAEKRRVTA